MFTGNLIDDLTGSVIRAEKFASSPEGELSNLMYRAQGNNERQLAFLQSLTASADTVADGNPALPAKGIAVPSSADQVPPAAAGGRDANSISTENHSE